MVSSSTSHSNMVSPLPNETSKNGGDEGSSISASMSNLSVMPPPQPPAATMTSTFSNSGLAVAQPSTASLPSDKDLAIYGTPWNATIDSDIIGTASVYVVNKTAGSIMTRLKEINGCAVKEIKANHIRNWASKVGIKLKEGNKTQALRNYC